MRPRYQHLTSIAFTMWSMEPDASDVTPEMLRAMADRRLDELTTAEDWDQAVHVHDTIPVPEGVGLPSRATLTLPPRVAAVAGD